MATLSPISDDDGNVIAVIDIVKDISSLIKNQELAIQAEKLSVIGQLAAGIAHEIRNPLTSLQGFLKLLSRQSNDLGTTYLSIMEGELARINLIVNEFLVLAKPHATQVKVVNGVELLCHVIQLLASQANMDNYSGPRNQDSREGTG